MRNKIVLVIFGVILLLIPTLACAVDDTAAGVSAIGSRLALLEKWQAEANAIIAASKTALDTKANKTDVDALKATPAATQGYTKAEVDAIKADLQTKIDAQKDRIDKFINPLPGQPSQNPINPATPAGQVSYVIQNPQQFYQFQAGGTTNIIAIRIFNNTATTQKVRPQISANVYQSGTNAGTITTTPTCTIASPQGQSNVTFVGTPLGGANIISVIFYASGGGFDNAGNFLLSSGSALDIYATITISTTNPVLWTIQVSGTNTQL